MPPHPANPHQLSPEDQRAEFVADLDRQLALADDSHVSGEQWWVKVDGLWLLRLRFRGSTLKVNGEADTAVLQSLAEVRMVLLNVWEAVAQGRLDESLQRVRKRNS